MDKELRWRQLEPTHKSTLQSQSPDHEEEEEDCSPYDFYNYDSESDDDDAYTQEQPADLNNQHAATENPAKLEANQSCEEKDLKSEVHVSSKTSERTHEEPDQVVYSNSNTENGSAEQRNAPLDIVNNESLWIAPPPQNANLQIWISDGEDNDDGDVTGEGVVGFSDLDKGSCNNGHKRSGKSTLEDQWKIRILHMDMDGISENWSRITIPLALQAVRITKPYISVSGEMDPEDYVKVKCLGAGLPNESQLVKGIVCTKNLAHKKMKTCIKNPRLLIVGCALESEMNSTQLSSLNNLLYQGNNFSSLLSIIETYEPNLVLVEKAVSCEAQEQILAKDISLVMNVKKSLLGRISRCTGADIIPSVDHLLSKKPVKVGRCGVFRVEKYIEEHGSAGHGGKKLSKTLMFFEDCPEPLGCTILLKGSNGDDLKKVKHSVQRAIRKAYSLELESALLADEGADFPEPILHCLSGGTLADNKSRSKKPIVTISCAAVKSQNQSETDAISSNGILNDKPNPRASDFSFHNSDSILAETGTKFENYDRSGDNLAPCIDFGQAIVALNGSVSNDERRLSFASGKQRLVFDTHKPLESELSFVSETSNQDDDMEDLSLEETFPPSPSDDQSILVSYTRTSLKKACVCERGRLLRITFYSKSDRPLGKFLQQDIFEKTYRCPKCLEPIDAHFLNYTHQQGNLTIYVHKQNNNLPDGKIWTWHRCLKCTRVDGIPPANHRVIMSDAALALSFGKFLQLSFSSCAAANSIASCGHSLYRDCLRFYGFGNMVACFFYSAVNVYDVYLPPATLEFHYSEHQEWLKQEVKEIAEKGSMFFRSVSDRLKQIKEKASSDVKNQISDLEDILSKQERSFQIALSKGALSHEAGELHLDILQLNQLRRSLSNCSSLWDNRMQSLLSSSKSLKPGFDVDSIFSFLKDISFGSGKIRKFHVFHNGRENGEDNISSSIVNPKSKRESQNTGNPEDTYACENSVKTVNGFSNFGNTDLHKESQDMLPSSDHPTEDKGSNVLSDGSFISEGQVLPNNVSSSAETFTGKCQNMDPDQKPILADVNFETLSTRSDSVASNEGSLEQSFLELKSPNVSSAMGDSSDIEGWVGSPYSSFSSPFTPSSSQVLSFSPSRTDTELQSTSNSFVSYPCEAVANSSPVDISETVVSLYDDEPTTIIANAIISYEHQTYLLGKSNGNKSREQMLVDDEDVNIFYSHNLVTNTFEEGEAKESDPSNSTDKLNPAPVHVSKPINVKVEFDDDTPHGKIKYTVTCYYAKQFDDLRKKCCPNAMDYIRSLCRCKKWGAQGGKSKVFFAKTADDRFVIKQVTRTELDSFMTFATAYFKYISDALVTGSPTCLAKILGIYQVIVKHMKGGKEVRMDLMIMENLLYGRKVNRIYDLKGSQRSRYNANANGKNAVLLDLNLLETNPIFIRHRAKRLLERAVWNDTAFLANIDVMDYSLLVGIDEMKRDLVVGIIDFMRQYTWDKHLETWVKAYGILGGSKNGSPTVISPQQYKKRFRKAMSTYFLMVPDEPPAPNGGSGSQSSELLDEGSSVSETVISVDDSGSDKLS